VRRAEALGRTTCGDLRAFAAGGSCGPPATWSSRRAQVRSSEALCRASPRKGAVRLGMASACPSAGGDKRIDSRSMADIEFGVFVVPDAADREAVLDQVERADRAGLDLVGIQDHPYQRRFLETFALLAFLAARTTRIRLFPDVANLPLRQPAVLAKAAATIGLLSGGRVGLGAGGG